MIQHFSRQRGFSLIELVVVISIIAVLVSVGAVAYRTTQQKSRDATRRGDMVALGNALEQYFVTAGSVYPESANCSELIGADAGTYLASGFPTDPRSGQEGFSDYHIQCSATSYCVCARLEADEGNSGEECDFGTSEDKEYYCVENRQ